MTCACTSYPLSNDHGGRDSGVSLAMSNCLFSSECEDEDDVGDTKRGLDALCSNREYVL
jgi:hypothetical protein